MKSINALPQTREEYGAVALLEEAMHPDPFEQFKVWFDQNAQSDPKTCNAMVLSTVDLLDHPDSRVVLLKELMAGEFVFYSHYTSEKGLQMASNPKVALNFYWSHQSRQVRIRGLVHRLSAEDSDEYFYSRPRESQLSGIASLQSTVIASRAELDAAYLRVCAEYSDKDIVRPESWGGYAVVPSQIEFWQGRDSRLHDRICYTKNGDHWQMQRLAP